MNISQPKLRSEKFDDDDYDDDDNNNNNNNNNKGSISADNCFNSYCSIIPNSITKLDVKN